MALGITHDRINYFIGTILTGLLFAVSIKWQVCLSFWGGWMFSTFIFSPDTDVMPKKRTKLLQFILYPYSIFFKHRGLSHHPLFGTLTRVFYGIIVSSLSIYVLNRMGHIDLNERDFFNGVWYFFKNFDLSLIQYQVFTFLYLGMFLADLAHIFVDKIWSFFKKIFKFL